MKEEIRLLRFNRILLFMTVILCLYISVLMWYNVNTPNMEEKITTVEEPHITEDTEDIPDYVIRTKIKGCEQELRILYYNNDFGVCYRCRNISISVMEDIPAGDWVCPR